MGATMGQQSEWDGIRFDEMIDKLSLTTPFLFDSALVPGHGYSGQADCARITMAERLRGETDRHDPTGMCRPSDRV